VSEEVWAWVLGFEGYYQVGSKGSVRSVNRTVVRSDGRSMKLRGRVLRPSVHPKGHLRLVLYRPGLVRGVGVHQLVAEAFIGPRPDGHEVRHYPDQDPANNRIENLSYSTHKINMNDMNENGTNNSRKTHCPHGHEYTPKNTNLYRGKRNCRRCAVDRATDYNRRKRLL
jgi:hypothetical protein